MRKKIAVDKFLGRDGERVNCAQAILAAFKDKFEVNNLTMNLFKQYSGGRAPEGMCGAYYATIFMLDDNLPEKIDDFEKEFLENMKTNKCKELKENKISCIECIEFCAEFLQEKGTD